MTSARTRRLTGALAVAALSVTGVALGSGTATAAKPGPTLDIQLLSFNDFHGNLEPPSGSGGRIVVDHFVDTADVDGDKNTTEVLETTVNAGGSEYLASQLAELRRKHAYSLTVAAGDIVGASPLLSAAFHDEPTIEAMNALGLDATAVGNHEFDEGYKELQRLQEGGCIEDGDGENNQNSCPDGSFDGADFPFLAANVTEAATGEPILPPYTIKNIKGAKVGFIGMTLEDTPNIVTAAGVAGLEFKDEVETANALVPELKAQGVNAVVVLLHEGGFPSSTEPWRNPVTGQMQNVSATYDYTCAEGGTLSGPVTDIAANLDPAIDMVVSGHTHAPYVCSVADPAGQPRMVTSASSFGRLVTETTLTYDRRTSDIVRTSVASQNVIVDRAKLPQDSAQTELISKYGTLVASIANRVLGSISQDIGRSGANANAGEESELGDLIADAQLADPSVVTNGQAPVIAFMNPGGIRADLTYASSPKGEGDGVVTFEEAFTVQPFNNYLVSMDLTGAQIKTLLNQQWSGSAPSGNNSITAPKILQVSAGFAYSYTGDTAATRTLGPVTLNGQPLVDGQRYRIATNNFLSDGGDGFPVFKEGQNKFFGGLDIDAFADYLEAHKDYSPAPLTRITKN
jgi:5'-nucleotidase